MFRYPVLGRVASAVGLLTALGTAQADPVPPGGTCEVIPPFTPNFAPVLEWEWTASSTIPGSVQVMMMPVVIDVSGDGIPDVLFNTFAGGGYNFDGHLRAISGADGSELWTVTDPAYDVRGAGSIAAGDLDGDLLPEICTVAESGNEIHCFQHDGTPMMTIPGAPNSWGGPSFADLDGDGSVEIINANQVFSAAGALLWAGIDGPGGHSGTGPVSFAADIDQDGDLEVINDRAIYQNDGTLLCRNTTIGHGLAGAANFDGDAYGEVVVVHNGQVALMDHDCTLLWNTAIPGAGVGGAPNIADFDSDGQPEIGVAGRAFYVVFETDGTVKWQQPVQDFSSNRTGSSTFDFEGDGASEVVYADERFLRIYDGATGVVRFQVAHSSGTTYENPVVADVDSDGNAEIVIASNNYAFPGVAGIRVFRDATDGWVTTRGIWNQHAYSVTNIDEDGTIPAYPATNWTQPGLNTFRSNSQGTGTTTPFAAPDLVVAHVEGECIEGTYEVLLSAHIHNQGEAPASAGVEVSFYLGDPSLGGILLGTDIIANVLPALGSADASLQVVAPGGLGEIYVWVDSAETETECIEDNNASSALVDLNCTPNDPPVALCIDLVLSADAACMADGSIDGGSYDPDGDPIAVSQDPAGPYGLGITPASLLVCDDSQECDLCEATITVIDDTPPTVSCNSPGTITPPDAPISFGATTTDNCGSTVAIVGYDCFKLDKDGNPKSKLDSCVVALAGDTISILDSGGVGTHITWTATATDGSGNAVSTQCEVVVENPGKGSGCNQGVGNGPEGCDPGNSNQGNPANTNDEAGGTPGNPGKKGGKK